MGSLEDDIRKLIKDWQDIKFTNGDPRARALTFTKLEEALMWAERIFTK